MAINENDMYVCDFCGEDTGIFNNETGNHVPCERLAKLEAIAEGMAQRLEVFKLTRENFERSKATIHPVLFWEDNDQNALSAYEAYKTAAALDEVKS